MKFVYQGYDKSGKGMTATVDAATVADAREQLRRQGLFVTHIGPATDGGKGASADGGAASLVKGRKRISGGKRYKFLAMFTRQLYVLLSTGTPIVDALAALERQAKDAAWKSVVADLREQVERGRSLSEAMSDHPLAFDAIYRSLIAAAEQGGKFEVILDRLSNLTRKQMQMRSQVMSAMVYPALLLTVSVVVLVAMLTFVLPRFATLFNTLKLPLPPTTKFMMLLSDGLIGYWWALVPGLIVTVVAVVYGSRTRQGRAFWDTALLRIPVVKELTQGLIVARIIRLLGVLGDSYVPVLDALALAKETTGNMHYRALVNEAENAVTRGDPISTAFKNERLVHPTVYEAMRSGEQTGKISTLLINMADFLDEENELRLKTATGLLEPVILIALGVMVGFVAVSMFLPLFDLTAQAGH